MKDTDSFTHDRWKGVTRPYTEDHVKKLRGHLRIEYTIADYASRRLWKSMKEKPLVRCARRAHRWPGRADGQGRAAGDLPAPAGRSPPTPTPPVRRPTPTSRSIPRTRCRSRGDAHQQRLAPRRPDRVHIEGVRPDRNYFAPIVADAEAGFGGPLNSLRADEAG
jgi:isocitrate lyase